jgi:pyruvate/2-oxoglutarate dehydrogenase complex dihydrolipoamide dehydrogenase (E3) component
MREADRMVEEADVVVVGLGVGGEEVAGKLAEAGLSVVGIEPRLVGGECPYWGCVPSKMMIRAANALAEARRVDGLAGSAQVRPDWAPVALRIRDEATDTWNDQVAVDRLVGKGARFIRGSARLVGPGLVEVGDIQIRARRGVVIATGTEPAIPPVPGLEGTPYWTNHEAIEADTLPDSLVVLGGGAIGLELAQVFARFGVRVTVVEALDRLLAAEEPEASALAEHALRADGIEVHTGAPAQRVDHSPAGFSVALPSATVHSDALLVATGRRARLDGLGLDTVGLDPAARHIDTDERMRARADGRSARSRAGDGLWALGDVTGHGGFTHLAMYHAGIVVADILDRPWPAADYRAVPRVTFTDPEIGAVGLTEQQARSAGIAVGIGTTQVASTARGWIHRGEGFIKLVADLDRGVLVGATSGGPVGGEVLSALAVAIHGEVPLDRLRHMIYAYPTFHRGIEDALRDLMG